MSEKNKDVLLGALIGLTGCLYLLQAFSPLRLDHDAVIYLNIALALANSAPVPHPDFPLGYPGFVALLDRAGLANAATLILANCAGIAIGLLAIFRLPGPWTRRQRLMSIALTLLSFAVLRTAVRPQSDLPFFGVSLAALWAMSIADDERSHWSAWAAAIGLTTVAISVRLVGVALVPALLLAFLQARSRRFFKETDMRKAAAGAISLAVALIAGAFLFRDAIARYGGGILQGWSGAQKETIPGRIEAIVAGLAELFVNVPHEMFDFWTPFSRAIGIPICVLALFGLTRARRITPAGAYVAATIVILLVWPFNAVRLWVPLAPLVFLFLIDVVTSLQNEQRPEIVRRTTGLVASAWALWFSAAGFAALAYSTFITFSGARFHEVYGNNGGFVTPGFLAANPQHNRHALSIFERYDPSHVDNARAFIARSGEAPDSIYTLSHRVSCQFLNRLPLSAMKHCRDSL